MSGEGYTGHVNVDSAPYQFKIPAATSTQNGVMTKEQAEKLEGIPVGGGGVQLTFGQLFTPSFSLPLDGSEVFVGGSSALRGSVPNQLLDSKRINSAQRFSKFGVTIPSPISNPTVVTVTLYRSIDGGQTYDDIVSVDLEQGTQEIDATFSPTDFPAKTLFCIGAQTEGSVFSCGLTATVS